MSAFCQIQPRDVQGANTAEEAVALTLARVLAGRQTPFALQEERLDLCHFAQPQQLRMQSSVDGRPTYLVEVAWPAL